MRSHFKEGIASITFGCDINTPHPGNGMGDHMIAVSLDNLEMMDLLLSNRVFVNPKDNSST